MGGSKIAQSVLTVEGKFVLNVRQAVAAGLLLLCNQTRGTENLHKTALLTMRGSSLNETD